MMKRKLSDMLDECLMLLEEGQVTLEECLARYPQYADDLRPLLEIALEMRRMAQLTSSPAAFASGKRRMLQALAEKKHRQLCEITSPREDISPVPDQVREQGQPSPLPRRRGWIAALFGERGGKPARRRVPAFRVALAAVLVLVLLVSGTLYLRSWLGTTIARMVTLEAMSGVVEVRPAEGETWLPASPAQRLEGGDCVRTGPLSAATLVFFDGSTTELEAETEVTIAQMISRRDGRGRVVILYQWVGRSHHRVERLPNRASRFEIETPATVAVVRGTEFSVAVKANGATQVEVWEGFVEVTAREKSVQVQSGEMTHVLPDLPPAQPVPAPTRVSKPTPTSLVPTVRGPRERRRQPSGSGTSRSRRLRAKPRGHSPPGRPSRPARRDLPNERKR
ncbi:MAG: FecR domain-containing protein [Chloroflexota bacterium]|nr:FecR domain-containing protein [Chloroflexota bacterium]